MATIEDQQNFYDQFWADRSLRLNAHELLRLGEIMLAIAGIVIYDSKRELTVCDLGCGTGWLSDELTKFGPVTAIELSPRGVELASQRWLGVHFEAQNILTWRPSEKFDLVVSSEVLEHIEDKEAFVNTVNYILKPGGDLVLTTPNMNVKTHWYKTGQGQQILEEWMTPGALNRLFGRSMQILVHRTFLYDFAYNGIFRVLSAPKLLNVIRHLRLWHAYNELRSFARLGLYQIIVCRKAEG